MTLKPLKLFACIVAATAVTACVDDKYDLSDIDTTVRIDVKDLTIPVNLDEILLESIIEEGDQIKIVDGQYVVTEEGTFTSSDIEIGSVSVASQELNPTVIELPFVGTLPGTAAAEAGHFAINAPVEHFSFNATDIPAEITSIKAIGGTLNFIFDFNIEGLAEISDKFELRNLVLQMPKGLNILTGEGESYNPADGLLTMPDQTVNGETFSLSFTADRADMETMGASFDYESHTLSVEGEFYVKSGEIAIAAADLKPGDTPGKIKLTINYIIPDFPVTSFSGGVKYDISSVNISDIDLSDLPDVLSQPGTDISLANPCIYIAVTNPVANYGLSARTGMTIDSWHGSASKAYSIDNPYFTIAGNTADGRSAYCLSPADPANKPAEYAGATHVPFTSLSKILSGDGMPDKLTIKLDDPCLPDQTVEDLPLGVTLGSVDGNYSFVAPIALCEGSKIVYSDVADGWGSEDLDCVTITELHIRASLTSDIPLNLDVAAYPIDAQGNQIGNVEIKGAKIVAGPEPQDVDIYITGSITGGLDGIRYEAVATAPANEQVLTPDMHIKVTNLRPTVTGYYTKEL